MIDLVIADDHFLVREGTKRLLEASGEVRVVDSVADSDALLAAVAEQEPAAVIVDIRMPPTHQMEGILAAREIRAEHPKMGIVVLSQHANAHYAFELFRDGTRGVAYLLKDRVGRAGAAPGCAAQRGCGRFRDRPDCGRSAPQ